MRFLLATVVLSLVVTTTGCGTTRWSDTARTATEQMLISDAIDRAVSQLDFTPLAGRDVYLDGRFITGLVDEKYVISTLRQHMFASGCIVKDRIDDAMFVVEVRAGALGTNRSDLLFGMPSTSLPGGGTMFPGPASIPEIPLVKRTAQQGVCKVAVFAYDRMTGHPVWQSGLRREVSKAKDVWVFGTGPFQRGTIYEGTKFAGEPVAGGGKSPAKADSVLVGHEILFNDPQKLAQIPVRFPAIRPPLALSPNPPEAPPAAVAGAPPPQPGQPAQPPNTSTAPNSAAGALGAWQAYDWAKTMRTTTTQK